MAGVQTSLRYYLGLAKQYDGEGNAEAPTMFPRWLDGATLGVSINSEEIDEGDGGRDATFNLKNSQAYAPNLPFMPRPKEFGEAVGFAFGYGSDSIAGIVAPFVHTLTPQSLPDWRTVEGGLATADLIARVADVICDEMTIEGNAGKPIKVTLKMRGKSGARQTVAASVTLEDGKPMLFHSGEFTIDGGATSKVESFKVTYMNTVDAPQTDAVTMHTFVWGRRRCRVEFGLLFENETFYRKLFYGGASGTADSPVMGNGSFVGKFYENGDDTSDNHVTLTIPSVDYTGGAPTPSLDGKAMRYAIQGNAVKTSGNALITVAASNEQAEWHSGHDAPTVAVTGTAVDGGVVESAIVAGGETIILTLTGDKWVTSAGSVFDGVRAAIIAGIDSAQAEANGFDAEKATILPVTSVVRTSDTIVTITLAAAAAYAITANETLTITVPAAALVSHNEAVVAAPTVVITHGS